uniref:Uncharacterized protein n=1 Tax=Anopheles atroparvus TaxID=41427 RepID=A0AAG5CP71_ANOAO
MLPFVLMCPPKFLNNFNLTSTINHHNAREFRARTPAGAHKPGTELGAAILVSMNVFLLLELGYRFPTPHPLHPWPHMHFAPCERCRAAVILLSGRLGRYEHHHRPTTITPTDCSDRVFLFLFHHTQLPTDKRQHTNI